MAVLFIAGTTASGKTSLSVELAQAFDAVVVSADAMTIYRGLDIGTAKPTLAERCGVPHYGIDIRDMPEAFDVSEFVALTERAIQDHERVIVAGGTTFWFSALLNPLAELPAGDDALRAELESIEDPHRVLAGVDPLAAERLHPNDRVRVIRALEVYRLTGQTQSELHALGPRRPPISAPVIWLDKPDLRDRIAERVKRMWAMGYLEETAAALCAHPTANVKPLRSFAYRHVVDHLRSELTLDEALRRTERDTWQYARKQRTWARNLGWEAADPSSVYTLASACFETTDPAK